MMNRRLAVIGLAGALMLGSATAALAAGGDNGPGLDGDCPGDCTGSRVQLQEQARVENQAEATMLQKRIREQVQDGSGDQVRNQAQEQQRLQLEQPAGDQQRLRLQDGDCDGTSDQDQMHNRARDRAHDGDGTPSANGQNRGNANGKSGGRGGK